MDPVTRNSVPRTVGGAAGIELKATLKMRKLLIPLNAENAKNTEFAQVRYTAGTRNDGITLAIRACPLSRTKAFPFFLDVLFPLCS